MSYLINEFELNLKSDVIDLPAIEEIIKQNPYNKVKREPSTPQRAAIAEYLEAIHFISIPRNYSHKKMIEFAEQKVLEKMKEEEARKLEPKIISPFDILRGDKTIIEYVPGQATQEEEEAYEWDLIKQEKEEEFKKGLLPRKQESEAEETPTEVVHDKVDIGSTPEGMIHPEVLSKFYDVVLPLGFKPKFKHNAIAPNRKPCITLSYVILDEIISLGALWKLNVNKSRYKEDLFSLIYWIQKDGEVIVRETFDDNYIVLR